MKNVARCARLFFFLGSCFISSRLGAAPILTLPHQEFKLSNGMKVFLVKYPSPGVVSYQLPVHVGSRNEIDKGKTGFAHFFEHLMFRGTKKRTSAEFGKIYNRLGCENNAFTSSDITNYHGVVATVYLPQILEAEADRFMNLSFDEKSLKDEAGAVFGEYNKDVAQPEFQLEEALAQTAFKVHTYAHTTMGYKEDILKFPERYKDVWPFFRRYYRPSNVSLVLVGDVDFSKTKQLVQKLFGSWKDPNNLSEVVIPQEPEQKEARRVEIAIEKPTQTRVTVGYKVPGFSSRSKDSAVIDLLSEYLFSIVSDFQKKYKFEKKWLDAIDASHGESVDPNLWTINMRLSEAGESHREELETAVIDAVSSMRNELISLPKLKAIQTRFQNGALTSWFSSPEALAGKLSWYCNLEADFGVIDRVFQRIREVKAEDIRDFAKKNLTDSHRVIAVLKGSGS